MKTLRQLMIALATGTTFFVSAANAASTTNYSDQWWIPSESGWGASVLQQWDTLFIDLFVYGSDNKPTWFTGAAYFQSSSPAGHAAGDLYATTGPYYGGPFNPAAVGFSKVGTLTFDADTVNTATLSYTVSGVPVTKSVTRQTWRNENLGGSYYGGWVVEQTNCTPASDNGHYEEDLFITITHGANNAVTMTLQHGNDSCTIAGTYGQSGHMGQLANASISCPTSSGTVSGSVNVFEIERSISGISGRINGEVRSPSGQGCMLSDGRFGGVRR